MGQVSCSFWDQASFPRQLLSLDAGRRGPARPESHPVSGIQSSRLIQYVSLLWAAFHRVL